MAAEELILAMVLMVVTVFLTIGIFANRYKRVPTDKAMVVYGSRVRGTDFVIIGPGGGKFIAPIRESFEMMDVGVHILSLNIPAVTTRSGVPVTVEAVGVVKIPTDKETLQVAARHWLGKEPDEVVGAAEEIFTGHLRTVAVRMEVEQLNADRDAFGTKVRESSAADLGKLGLEALSFTVKDLSDEVGYLEALGKRRTAEVKRDAILAEATARADAMRRTAEIQKEADIAVAKTNEEAIAKIAEVLERAEAQAQAARDMMQTNADYTRKKRASAEPAPKGDD